MVEIRKKEGKYEYVRKHKPSYWSSLGDKIGGLFKEKPVPPPPTSDSNRALGGAEEADRITHQVVVLSKGAGRNPAGVDAGEVHLDKVAGQAEDPRDQPRNKADRHRPRLFNRKAVSTPQAITPTPLEVLVNNPEAASTTQAGTPTHKGAHSEAQIPLPPPLHKHMYPAAETPNPKPRASIRNPLNTVFAAPDTISRLTNSKYKCDGVKVHTRDGDARTVGKFAGFRRATSDFTKFHAAAQDAIAPAPYTEMLKRKHPEHSPSPTDDSAAADRALKRQRKLCSQRIEAAQKALVPALRLGAGLERQKYSRRKKAAKEKKDDKATARLEAEYVVLKSLDLTKAAEQHVRRTIAKVKSIKDHEALPRSTKDIDKGEKDAVTLNVTARLYKANGVRDAVDKLIDDLKEILGNGGALPKVDKEQNKDQGPRQKKARPAAAEEDVLAIAAISDDDNEAFAAFDARIAAPSSAEEDSDDSLLEGQRPPSIGDSESDNETDADGDLEDESDSAAALEFHEFTQSSSIAQDSESDSDSDGVQIPKLKPRISSTQLEKASKSTFLPSLSHMTYYSGSDSEASDLDEPVAPKKNRRGQRARQQIWEAKYGDKAKHVQNDDKNKGDSRGGKGASTGRGPERTGENAMPLGLKKTKRDDTGSLHPSWLAAKAAKEKSLSMKPQGTKVVFD
ncbi:BUD22-domain-containing protein [Massariosphaeria phaeospora]|uniref:BUD22-domain-containing protein n=1 Tax=Massariosphaeria phaeospora TaxID=100035 RepID=A0A7C8M4I8_9PLEO|nr:BUD22-domain-containing protein [Massariosphaeria phaeospora]